MYGLVAGVAVGGCGETVCELPAATGGTAAQRAVADDEAATWFDRLTPGPFCVTAMAFTEVEDGFIGQFNSADRHVELDNALSADDEVRLRRVVRHEFCHALDLARQLARRGDPLWDLVENGNVLPSMWESEAFAQTCERGPDVLHRWAAACPDDDPGAQAFASAALAFTPPTDALEVTATFQEIGAFDPEVGTITDVRASDRGVAGEVTIAVTGVDASRRYTASLYDDVASDLALTGGIEIGQSTPPRPRAFDLGFGDRDDYAGEPSIQLFTAHQTTPAGAVARRVILATDDGGWTVVACARPHEDVFYVNATFGSAYVEDGRVHWGLWRLE